jgi:hypothetical protein
LINNNDGGKHEPIRDENVAYTRPKENFLSDKPYEIVHRAMDKIIEINQNCKNHKRDLIFKQKVHELSRIIEKPCASKEQFINFTLNLYIMIYETTREKKSNYTKGKPFYDYKLPDEFLKNGTTTRYFMDIVGTLRHHYAHLEPEYKIQINKIPYEDVLFKLLGNRNEPKSKENFQKLQVEILKMFDETMEKLEMKINELNSSKNH